MLKIFPTTDDSSHHLNLPPVQRTNDSTAQQKTTAQEATLRRQLESEFARRFFLEEALAVLKFQITEDDSTRGNLLNLLNRTANSKQVMIVSAAGDLIESSACAAGDQTEHRPSLLTQPSIDWLIDRAIAQARKTAQPSFTSRINMDCEALITPLVSRDQIQDWLIAISDPHVSNLHTQRELFETATKLLKDCVS